MSVSCWIRLFSECFRIAKWSGVWACFRFFFGRLQLSEIDLKSLDFSGGDLYV